MTCKICIPRRHRILEGQPSPLVCHRDTNEHKPFFGKAHPEEFQLVVVRDLVPTVICKFPREVLEVVGTAAANGRLFPSAITGKRNGFTLRRHVLGRRLIVIVDLNALCDELISSHMAASAATGTTQKNAPRQPINAPRKLPAGAAITVASAFPPLTIASARGT